MQISLKKAQMPSILFLFYALKDFQFQFINKLQIFPLPVGRFFKIGLSPIAQRFRAFLIAMADPLKGFAFMIQLPYNAPALRKTSHA